MIDIEMLACGAQQTAAFDLIKGKTIDDAVIPVLPATLPSSIQGWYKAKSTTGVVIGAAYIDTTDAIYNYKITIKYKTGTCINNPVTDCTCFAITKTNKSNVNQANNTLPTGMMATAMAALPIVSATTPPESWFNKKTCYKTTCVPNWGLVGAGGILAYFLLTRK